MSRLDAPPPPPPPPPIVVPLINVLLYDLVIARLEQDWCFTCCCDAGQGGVCHLVEGELGGRFHVLQDVLAPL